MCPTTALRPSSHLQTSGAMADPDGSRAGANQRELGMLVRAAVTCNVAIAVTAVIILVMGNAGAAGQALVAGAVTLLFFATGQGVQLIAADVGGHLGLGIAVMSFVVRAGLLGLALLLATGLPGVEGQLSAPGIVGGTLGAVAGWVAGLIWAELRGRNRIYDQP